MGTIATVLVALVALEHLGIMALEMAYWDHPVGRKIFKMSAEQSAATRMLALNQGLYNGFLAAGLFWGLLSGRSDVAIFFLVCVIVAGIAGALTAKGSILVTQALPAALALAALLL